MIIYNITVKVDWLIFEDWMKWMKEVQVPAMLNTGLFVECRMLRLLETDETDGPTFAIQYHALSLKEYNQYLSDHLVLDSRRQSARWGERVVQFTTVMEVMM